MAKIALQRSTADDTARKCAPNLLPCRIHRDGPVDASPRYWSPEIGEGTSFTSPQARMNALVLPKAKTELTSSIKALRWST